MLTAACMQALPPTAAHRATTGKLYAVYLLQELYRKSRGLRADRVQRAESTTMLIKAGGADALPEPSEMRRQLSTEVRVAVAGGSTELTWDAIRAIGPPGL